MAKARKLQINLTATTFYHCVSRCVRRAFLCGFDHYSGINYEHRKKWVENKILLLGKVMGIDVCAYAVMSNHLHLVLRVDKTKALEWTDLEVLSRWHELHRGTLLTRKYCAQSSDEGMTTLEKKTIQSVVQVYRARLMDISWFMRILNEFIARKANAEDECKGRFWEGRFYSQAILDNKSLIACMLYVDSNPVRVKNAIKADSLEFTSIKLRNSNNNRFSPSICSFSDTINVPADTYCLPIRYCDYIEMYNSKISDYRSWQRNQIENEADTPLSKQHSFSPYDNLESCFAYAVGTPDSLELFRVRNGLRHVKGQQRLRSK